MEEKEGREEGDELDWYGEGEDELPSWREGG